MQPKPVAVRFIYLASATKREGRSVRRTKGGEETDEDWNGYKTIPSPDEIKSV